MVVIKLGAYLKKKIWSPCFWTKNNSDLVDMEWGSKIYILNKTLKWVPWRLDDWKGHGLCAERPPLTHPVEQACLLRLPSFVPCESKSPPFWEKPSANLEWFPSTPEQKASLPPISTFSLLWLYLTKLPLEFNSRNCFRFITVFTDAGWTASEEKTLPVLILLPAAGCEFVMN